MKGSTLDRGAKVHVLCEENTRRGLALLRPLVESGKSSEAIARPLRVCACECLCSRSASKLSRACLTGCVGGRMFSTTTFVIT
jgi:hypothetical protein